MVYTYRDYTDAQLIENAKNVTSMSALITSVGLIAKGGNFKTFKKHVFRLNINTSHWINKQGWNEGLQLREFHHYTRISNGKKHLIYKRGHKCEKCNLNEWLDQPIMLEIDHIDGDNSNNYEDNLRLLCPNCHAQTPTWRGRSLKGRSRIL